MVIEGWQLADREQTLFSYIKCLNEKSHFHAFTLSHLMYTHKHSHTCTFSFPLNSLPKLKDFEGLTQPSGHVHNSIFTSTKEWIKFHQTLFEFALWDARTRFMSDLKILQIISISLKTPVKHHHCIHRESYKCSNSKYHTYNSGNGIPGLHRVHKWMKNNILMCL